MTRSRVGIRTALYGLTAATVVLFTAALLLPLSTLFPSALGAILVPLALIAATAAVVLLIKAHAREALLDPDVLFVGNADACAGPVELLGLEKEYIQDVEVFLRPLGAHRLIAAVKGAAPPMLSEYLKEKVTGRPVIALMNRIEAAGSPRQNRPPWLTTLEEVSSGYEQRQETISVVLFLNVGKSTTGRLLERGMLDLGTQPAQILRGLREAVWRGAVQWLEQDETKPGVMDAKSAARCEVVRMTAAAHDEIGRLIDHLDGTTFGKKWNWNRTLLLNTSTDRAPFGIDLPLQIAGNTTPDWLRRRLAPTPRDFLGMALWSVFLFVAAAGALALCLGSMPGFSKFLWKVNQAQNAPNGLPAVAILCDEDGPGVARYLQQDHLTTSLHAQCTTLLHDEQVERRRGRSSDCRALVDELVDHCRKPESPPPLTATKEHEPPPQPPDCAGQEAWVDKLLEANNDIVAAYPFTPTETAYLPLSKWPSAEYDRLVEQGARAASDKCHGMSALTEKLYLLRQTLEWRLVLRGAVALADGYMDVHVAVQYRSVGGCTGSSVECEPRWIVDAAPVQPVGWVDLDAASRARTGSVPCSLEKPIGDKTKAPVYHITLGERSKLYVNVPLRAEGAGGLAVVRQAHSDAPNAGPWALIDVLSAYDNSGLGNPPRRFGSERIDLGSGQSIRIEVVPLKLAGTSCPGSASVPMGWYDFLGHLRRQAHGTAGASDAKFVVDHCGGIGLAPCSGGTCSVGTACETTCVDTSSDVMHCGRCAAPCLCEGDATCEPSNLSAFRMCEDGRCQRCGGIGERPCPGGHCRAAGAPCGETGHVLCVDVAKDNANCGACSVQCAQFAHTAGDHACKESVCVCAGAFDTCHHGTGAPYCETSTATADHCGSCATKCSGESPACVADPAAPQAHCVDLASDTKNCGAERHACASAEMLHEEPTCSGGRCKCQPDWLDADHDAASGCEAHVPGAPQPQSPPSTDSATSQ